MRPLTDGETEVFFKKLARYIGNNIKHLIERSDGNYVFRLHKKRVYYVEESLMKRATNISRENLRCLGVCFGRFTGSGKFTLAITALDYLARYAKYKIWLKPSAEQSFLYGNHVLKGGLGRITDNTPQYQGVVVYSMNDVPLGFAASSKSTQEARKLEASGIVAFHQADIGEYIRTENTLA